MNILILETEEITNNRTVLTDRRAEHIVKVLKSRVGDRLKAGVLNGSRGSAEIVELESRRPFSVSLKLDLESGVPPVPKIDLLLALPRPIMLKRILSQATALGVGRIFLIHANRVEKSFWDANLLDSDRMAEQIVQGLEQCGDTRMVQFETHMRFRPFVEDYLPGLLSQYETFLVADPSGELSVRQHATGLEGRCLLGVGPEGGWVDFELEKFSEQGAEICHLGERILKVDTAVVALHAQISAVASWPEYRF